MAEYAPSVFRHRREQVDFPLSDAEISRLHRFGEARAFAGGEYLIRAGDVGHGIVVILSGRVKVARREAPGERVSTTTYADRHFVGEIGQLQGGVCFFDARADTDVEVLAISPPRLRALIVAEAELGERIMRALILRRIGLIETGAGGPMLIGSPTHPSIVHLQNFLLRNGVPHRVLDPAVEDEARTFLAAFEAERDVPVVVCPDGTILRKPDDHELAVRVGLVPRRDPGRTYDVAIVGAGPAGLAAAVYAASEGLSVVVLESNAIGGQAGASSRIENYLGFPTGITGQALAGRAFIQAQKFGAEVIIPGVVETLDCADPDTYRLRLLDGTIVRTRTVVIASGAEYRRPEFSGVLEAERHGLHYWASPVEGKLCSGQEVVLVGGGNSAGQAAVYLAGRASRVWMLVRGAGLHGSMSSYLIDRIEAQPNIEVLTHTEVVGVQTDESGALCCVEWRNRLAGEFSQRAVNHLFLFMGAEPCTGWLAGCGVALDAKGFVLTGVAARAAESSPPSLMTNVDGLFAVGDVRSGSMKRAAAAVGEGAAVVSQIHAYLAHGAATAVTRAQ